LAFDGCDMMAITFLFYETNESAIKMITLLLLMVDCCMLLVARQNLNATIVFKIETVGQ
jgi:hypothetical protein